MRRDWKVYCETCSQFLGMMVLGGRTWLAFTQVDAGARASSHRKVKPGHVVVIVSKGGCS